MLWGGASLTAWLCLQCGAPGRRRGPSAANAGWRSLKQWRNRLLRVPHGSAVAGRLHGCCSSVAHQQRRNCRNTALGDTATGAGELSTHLEPCGTFPPNRRGHHPLGHAVRCRISGTEQSCCSAWSGRCSWPACPQPCCPPWSRARARKLWLQVSQQPPLRPFPSTALPCPGPPPGPSARGCDG